MPQHKTFKLVVACWCACVSAHHLALPLQFLLLQILPVVVGVRQYSARLEMFRQLAKQLDPAEVRISWLCQDFVELVWTAQIRGCVPTAASAKSASMCLAQLLSATATLLGVLRPQSQHDNC